MARTPSKEAHERVLDAALDLIATHGVDGASMDAIARASGVSKATVYKHWKGKDDLCLEAIGRLAEELPRFETGDSREDLTSFLRYLATARKSEKWSSVWPKVIGYAATHPEFGHALRERANAPRRAEIERLLKQAAARGDLRAGIDPDLAMDCLVGPILHRRLMNGGNAAGLAEQVVELLWSVWSVGRSRRRS